MNSMEERVVNYYNELIKSEKISLGHEISLDWLKKQRLLEGRKKLEIEFGKEIINSILGKKTFLEKAEEMLEEVEMEGNYSLLPEIACNLAWECDTTLETENYIRDQYSSLDTRIPIFLFSSKDEYFINLHSQLFEVNIEQFKLISNYTSYEHLSSNPHKASFFEYVNKSAFFSLKDAFEKIKKAVEKQTM